MENLFLEILRILDRNYHKKNTDFYLFTFHYSRLILSKSVITKDLLQEIAEKIFTGNENLFLASKVEHNIGTGNKFKINIDDNFLRSRDILFYIIYYLNFIIKQNEDVDLTIEKDFFGIKDDLLSSFKIILNYIKQKKPLINILDICDDLSEINKNLIHSFIYDSKFEIEDFNSPSKKINDMNYNFTTGLFIFLKYKNFDIGLKKTFDYNFMVSLFYIMFQLLSMDINDIDLVKIYNNLNYLL